MDTLIITEKPAASEKIAQALADNKIEKKYYKKVPYYEITNKDKKIIIACAVGHLFNLKEKEKSQWKYPVFELAWAPSYQTSKSAKFTKDYLDNLKRFSKQDLELINSCDYDTEGETIFYLILTLVFKKRDAKRMKFSTLTKEDLLKAFEDISPHIDKPLAESGITRHFMDFFWGVSSSKALTNSLKMAGTFKILSSGRVQSPTLTLLADREKEIQIFNPEDFWQLFALIEAEGEINAVHEKDKFFNQEEVKKICEKCKNKEARVQKMSKKEFTVRPPVPFNITSLQTEAYKHFRFSPKQTLDIAQSLYLKAVISYPRTSSEKLSENINYKKIITSLSGINEFKKNAQFLLSKPQLKPNQGKKMDPAHIAIYPTSSPPKSLSALNEQQKKVYSLIVKRFLATFGDLAKRETINIIFNIENEIFLANGARTITLGWISIYQPYAKFKENILPYLKENQTYHVKELTIKKDQTKPPNRYSQGSIIVEMEKRNLGTRATRSNILQILYDRHYIEDKSIKVTPLGIAVATALENNVPDLVSEKLTRHFEKEMEQIQQGKKTREEVLEEAKKVLTSLMKEFKEKEIKIGEELLKAVKQTREQSSIVGICPSCNSELKITYSKKNKSYFIACSAYPKCKTTFSIPYGLPKPTNKKCETCNYPLVQMIRKKSKPYLYCLNKNCKLKEEWLKKQQEKAKSV